MGGYSGSGAGVVRRHVNHQMSRSIISKGITFFDIATMTQRLNIINSIGAALPHWQNVVNSQIVIPIARPATAQAFTAVEINKIQPFCHRKMGGQSVLHSPLFLLPDCIKEWFASRAVTSLALAGKFKSSLTGSASQDGHQFTPSRSYLSTSWMSVSKPHSLSNVMIPSTTLRLIESVLLWVKSIKPVLLTPVKSANSLTVGMGRRWLTGRPCSDSFNCSKHSLTTTFTVIPPPLKITYSIIYFSYLVKLYLTRWVKCSTIKLSITVKPTFTTLAILT
jgi:hypothetical protein